MEKGMGGCLAGTRVVVVDVPSAPRVLPLFALKKLRVLPLVEVELLPLLITLYAFGAEAEAAALVADLVVTELMARLGVCGGSENGRAVLAAVGEVVADTEA